jgi:hypothetical protein
VTSSDLLLVGVAVFVLMVVGVALTVVEFRRVK